ncbi:MAG: deoxyribonuclease IV [Phycisphaerae bacterium]
MFGSHLSIAGGMERALLEAESLGLDTVQVFTRNQQQWRIPPLEPAGVELFRHHAQRLHFDRIVAHDSYLINLAADDLELRQKSIDALATELERCDRLGIFALVTHGGSHGGAGEATGIARLIESINTVLAKTDARTLLCLETTAGQGASLNYRFEHIRDVIAAIEHPARVAVCMDTAHIFAAGYDLQTAESTQRVLDEFDRVIGINRLAAMHLNDSLKSLASRVDRHAHIGRGMIGLEAFSLIVRHPGLKALPKILETPKGDAPDGRPLDAVNLQLLKLLEAGAATDSAEIKALIYKNPLSSGKSIPESPAPQKPGAKKDEVGAAKKATRKEAAGQKAVTKK